MTIRLEVAGGTIRFYIDATDQNQIDEFGYNTNECTDWENTIEIKQEFGKNNFTLGGIAYD